MMDRKYKPDNYNSLSPYLIVDDCATLAELLQKIFKCNVRRKFEKPGGKIGHMELMIGDSVLMMADSVPDYPAHRSMMHVYVPDVEETFREAVALGCEAVEQPVNKPAIRICAGRLKILPATIGRLVRR